MTAVSQSFTLTVTAPATTVLSDIASSLSPGQWSNELADTNYWYLGETHPLRDPATPKINDLIDSWGGVEPLSGSRRAWQGYNANDSSTQLLAGAAGPYAATGWDTQTGLWHVAGTVWYYPYSQTIVNYNPATDEFKHWGGSYEGDDAGALWDFGAAHNFGASALDLRARRIFRNVSDPSGNDVGRLAWAYIDDLRNGLDRTNARRVTHSVNKTNCYNDPIIHFPDAGAAGRIHVIDWRRNGTPVWPCFDLATESWDASSDFAPPSGAASYLHALPVRAYYEGYNYVAGCRDGNKFWRVDADGNFAEMAPTPVPMNGWSLPAYIFTTGELIGQQNLYNTQFVAMNGYIYAFFPGDQAVSGYNGAVYRYDIAGDAWDGPIDDLPQKVLGVEFGPNPALGAYLANFCNYSVCAVPELNVVIFLQNRGASAASSLADFAVVWKPPA